MSIVRDNLLNRPGYAPYCGDDRCRFGMPRTAFKADQFECMCGWRSSFEVEFIDRYKAARRGHEQEARPGGEKA